MTYKKQQGVTLLEIMLVIVIVAGLIYLSMQQYVAYRKSADAHQVRSNVDVLFEAMNSYYKSNCYGQTSNTSTPSRWGTLNPNAPSNPLSTPNFPIDITNDLRNNGFLTLTIPTNSIVDNPTGQDSGYVLQFNLKTTPRTVCTQPVVEGKPIVSLEPSGNCAATNATMGTIVSWQAQVAVKIKDTKDINTYMNEMGADCISNLSGTYVVPCSQVPANQKTADYVVWQRSPSLGSFYNGSPYWSFNHIVTQFTNSYRTYNSSYLMETSGKINAGSSTTTQYFVCGD